MKAVDCWFAGWYSTFTECFLENKMIIKDSGTEFFVRQYGFEGVYIRLSDHQSYLSVDLNKEQLHELYQYIKACVSDQPIDDVLNIGLDFDVADIDRR